MWQGHPDITNWVERGSKGIKQLFTFLPEIETTCNRAILYSKWILGV